MFSSLPARTPPKMSEPFPAPPEDGESSTASCFCETSGDDVPALQLSDISVYRWNTNNKSCVQQWALVKWKTHDRGVVSAPVFLVTVSFPDDLFFSSESILAISRQLKDMKSPFPDKQQVSERSSCSRVSVWKHGRIRTEDYKWNKPIRTQIPAVYIKVVLQLLLLHSRMFSLFFS